MIREYAYQVFDLKKVNKIAANKNKFELFIIIGRTVLYISFLNNTQTK